MPGMKIGIRLMPFRDCKCVGRGARAPDLTALRPLQQQELMVAAFTATTCLYNTFVTYRQDLAESDAALRRFHA
jgi:hypothetical protein